MLLQFTVENFKSIKNQAVLSLEASASKEHPNNVAEVGKDRILKGAAIFGANAAGKSNLFKALTAGIMTVRTSNTRQVGEPLKYISPYAFDQTSSKLPTRFEFVFIHEKKKYVYGFAATVRQVISEYLYIYNTAKPTTIFERDETAEEKYRFTLNNLKSKLKPITERNTPNKLFLATSAMWNCEETQAPLTWFMQGINTFDQNYEHLLYSAGQMIEADADGSLRNFMRNILHEADINVADYEFESRDVTDNNPSSLPLQLQGIVPIEKKEYEIRAIHEITDENGVKARFKLGLHEESRGTQGLFFFSPFIKRALLSGETLCFDEFDTGLHPMLVLYLMDLFNNPEVNKTNAQLIISTHTVALLDLKHLRRDQIYFVDKNQNNGISELYSLDEFSPRTREDISKAYMLGRYGSVPFLGEGDSLWE